MGTFKGKHVIVGAGPVGQHLARLLTADRAEVVVVTRRGSDTALRAFGTSLQMRPMRTR